ncbi:hypothetical protein N7512_010304 [Penicillium capsulatum]|nr:hypothetical protein N7512_010304 [Penicillium capsulatum]
MQAIVRVISYIFLLTCITSPSSYAGPILHTSPRNGTDRISPRYVSPQTPSSGFELDGQTLSPPLPTDWQANPHAGTALTKKDNQIQYVATYDPEVDPPKWTIRVQNDVFHPALDGVFYITGWMKKTKSEPIGKGSQGSVFEGTWQDFDKPTRSDLALETDANCPEPAAIKISPGRGGYDAAEVIMDIGSGYIVEVFAWGLETVPAFKWTDKKTYTQKSTVAFERLEATTEYMIQKHPDFERASFIRALMQGVIDAMDKGYIIMDLKLDNVMIEKIDIRGVDAVWKIIDVDMWISASVRTAKGYMGTLDYLPPGEFSW